MPFTIWQSILHKLMYQLHKATYRSIEREIKHVSFDLVDFWCLQNRTFFLDHVVLYTIMKNHLYINPPKLTNHRRDTTTMQAESPVAQFAGMNLNQADDELPEYVSSVGSSVSQQNKKTMEVDAGMVDNAVSMLHNLHETVLTYYIFS